ncbi:calcium-independent phospholipase A2-gamma-like [Brachionichthys hirsutus]|uniref:calcium-independent phospholipase A2-gamma-like n=1 Tax=Brachionichthys hirsutus TaxID=412623 RepID=UPI003604B93E
MSLLRKCPSLAKAQRRLDVHRSSLLPPPLPSRLTKNPHLKHLHHLDISSTSYIQSVRFCSASETNVFKAEAPIGIFEDIPAASSNFSSLRGHVGQSLNRLSRHINIYFKRKDFVTQAESACLVATPVRSQRRSQSQQAAGEQRISEGKGAMQTLKFTDKAREPLETSPSSQGHFGLQLFHVSSLVTTFGESYSYVANHINSVFSRNFAKVPLQEDLERTSAATRTRRRKKRQRQRTQVESDHISSYLHFARHINKYFGAKVGVDQEQHSVEQNPKNQSLTQATSQSQGAVSQQKEERATAPEYGGLFHSSRDAADFGGNYFQTASHINRYFNGQSGLDEDIDEVDAEAGFATSERSLSFMDCLHHPTSIIPDFLGAYLKMGPSTLAVEPKGHATSPEALFNKKFVLSPRRAEEEARGLMGGLAQASSPEAVTACVEALNQHLISYPSCKAVMWQEKTAVTLLRKRQSHGENQALQSAVRETLALIGYVDPVRGRGIRVLSIDGGGTRGVVPLQMLKLLEAETGKKIHQLFDYICGVSTGAVLAFMLGLVHFSLEECADMYRRFGSEVFRQNPLVGTVRMGWSHSYYNTETWEKILQEKLGHKLLIKTAGDASSPKVSAVSTVVNWGSGPKAFVFRNYNHQPGSLSRYAGGSGFQMWEAVRASSAAPGYFQEFPLQSDIHQDGGIILNNPCALAVHESRLLWPNQPFQCVLSLGTGRHDNAKRVPITSTSLKAKIGNLIYSATDTEGVHTLLDDLLAPDVYFRFNPLLSVSVSLDESRPEALDQLQKDTRSYLERNGPKVARLCLVLGAERSAISRTRDWMSERAWVMRQRWVRVG